MREFTRNNWDETFRADALALLKRSNRSLTGVAADLGVPYSTLRAWYKAHECSFVARLRAAS